ncbi:MAG: putative type II secretion system protein F [Syntrophomonadaceae bacterium]|nr:putative type II secretion system protein F [Bacillota bacterium]
MNKPEKKRPAFLRFAAQEQIFFAKRLGMILRAGMPIMHGLHMLGQETRSRSATYIFKSLTVDVSNGHPLSTGLGKFQNIFGEFCINIVKVGETSGTLHENLDYLAEELKKKQALKRKVLGALIYPAVIIAATVGITVMLTVYIFPKIIPIFQSVKATLPLSTRMLIVLSDFLNNYGLWLFGGIVALGIGFFFLMRLSSRFHLWMDIVLLRTPLLGSLSRDYNLANATRTLSLLLKSDVGVIRSMELVAASTRNHAYRRALYEAALQITRGQKISQQFQKTPRLFPPLMTQMVLVGESTGNLSSSLMFLSDMYEEEIEDLTKNLTTMLEPILMIVMGAIVGFIAISIITPIYSITQNLTPR